MQSKKTHASVMAFGGIMAALALVIMAMGTLIPVATFVCPAMCMLVLQLVLKTCGSRIAWAWYGAVAILSVLMAPDKEAAAVFGFLGHYPIVKPCLDRARGRWLWKGLLFNGSILLMYWLLIALMGMNDISEDYAGMGTVLTALMLVLGNVTFFLLDRLLERKFRKR